ncbi:winged helix-turn-helix domain-containing protein [Streptomyces sp. SID3915]|uniref:winged helix-turn-helix domain-containing protein n=1 Tax=Streptomyces sp. SID3915 TaxID=2690263 RepID=UPI00136E554F|nr:winged helix-turn-helix domain-containing protein [Streptomyces sp. SID3915]MYX75084.1 ATP-binding protein [Streptomyces sp. SID3915]
MNTLNPASDGTSVKPAPVKPRRAMALRTSTTNALDALSPALAPFAARWDAEAKRRFELRTPENLKKLLEAQAAHTSARSTAAKAKAQRSAARKASRNPLSTARRSAATADKAARTHQKSARATLKAARVTYPATLMSRAVQAHAVHVVPSAVASYALSTAADWVMWPGLTSAALVAANAGALWLGRRSVEVAVEDGVSAEERRLLERLDPSYWVQHASEEGLERTLTERPVVTAAGIVCGVRLDGKGRSWKWLAGEADAVRRLLGMKTGTRMEIAAGSHGDRATITIRTRSAADGIDLKGWRPGDCWAIDTITGELLSVPLGKRMLVAGTSGAGKSYSARPLLAEASEHADHRLVIFDRKYIEARTWEHRARTAVELDGMRELCDELEAEGEERLKDLPRGRDVIDITLERPRITVFVDEGAELLDDARTKYEDEDGKKRDYQDVIGRLRTIARKYRAAEIILVWATQKPTMSGDGHGLDSQIAGQMSVKLGLAVASQTDAQTVFGRSDWPAHDLPMPGYALLFDQDKGPDQRRNPIKLRFMDAQQVIDLPARPIWSRSTATAGVPAAQPAERPALRLVKDEAAATAPAAKVEAAPAAAPATNRDRVLEAVRDGARTGRDIADRTGLNKGTVSKLVKALIESGDLVKDADAGLLLGTTGTEEVSA